MSMKCESRGVSAAVFTRWKQSLYEPQELQSAALQQAELSKCHIIPAAALWRDVGYQCEQQV